MLSQPVLKLRELDCARLLQGTRCKPTHPIVRSAKRLGYFAMLPDAVFNRFPGLFDAFLDIHVLTL